MHPGRFSVFVILTICLTSVINAQTGSTVTYIVIRIDGQWDYARSRNFIKINAETGNSMALEIYNLKEYISAKKAVNSGASFYSEKNDTTSVYFNYFLTATEIMQFLADHNWQLITVNTEISSDYENIQEGDRYIPVTKIRSRPVYYLKKEISR
jgi:hypothetical protein